MKKYILIAGVNGAGKSTLYQTINSLQYMERINTDEIVRSFGRWDNPADVLTAGKIAVKQISDYFDKGISFNQETTLCGAGIIKNLRKAKSLGYYIEIHYVGLDSIDLAKQRIAHRVKQGGHGIPDIDVERRYLASLQALNSIKDLCDRIICYDNTKSFIRFATYENSHWIKLSEFCPKWFQEYIS